MSKFVVGLTGGIGSGKTTVANQFSALGIDLVDADILSREVVEPGSMALSQIADYFGAEIIDGTGSLDRSALRAMVFETPSKREWLEALLHPLIRQLMLDRIAESDSAYCILVSPLLLETDQNTLVDRVLVVDVSVETQLERTLKRDGSDISTIEAIIEAQIDRDSRLKRADDIISNEKGIDEVNKSVLQLHTSYLKMSQHDYER